MEILLALVVAVFAGLGLHLMLTRSFVRIVLGIGLLSNAANLLVFTAAGLTRGKPPLIDEATGLPPAVYADPLPQALVLTAIVITFGLQAFALVLVYRVYRVTGTDDPDVLVSSEADAEAAEPLPSNVPAQSRVSDRADLEGSP